MLSDKPADYFFGSYHYEKQTLLFRKLMSVLIAVKCIYWLFYFELLFSDTSVIFVRPYISGSIRDLAFLLTNHGSPALCLAFILTALALSVFLFFARSTYLVELILWLIILNVHNRIYPTLSGGDHLLSQLLFFHIFICVRCNVTTSNQTLRRLLHNLAVAAIILQVCLVYFLSALAKLNDGAWLHGDAVRIIAGVNHFTLVQLSGWPPLIYTFLNYFVLLYQILFPLLALLKRTKRVFIAIGVTMHLYIAVVTGLPGFAAVMLLSYIYFWPMNSTSLKN